MNRSERRIHNNRIRRKRELKRKLYRAFLTLGMVFVFSLTASGFLSDARASVDGTEYKYYKSVAVKEGDSLWSIAEENMGNGYKGTEDYIKEVRMINHLEGDHITAGNYLVIPYYSEQFVGDR